MNTLSNIALGCAALSTGYHAGQTHITAHSEDLKDPLFNLTVSTTALAVLSLIKRVGLVKAGTSFATLGLSAYLGGGFIGEQLVSQQWITQHDRATVDNLAFTAAALLAVSTINRFSWRGLGSAGAVAATIASIGAVTGIVGVGIQVHQERIVNGYNRAGLQADTIATTARIILLPLGISIAAKALSSSAWLTLQTAGKILKQTASFAINTIHTPIGKVITAAVGGVAYGLAKEDLVTGLLGGKVTWAILHSGILKSTCDPLLRPPQCTQEEKPASPILNPWTLKQTTLLGALSGASAAFGCADRLIFGVGQGPNAPLLAPEETAAVIAMGAAAGGCLGALSGLALR